MTDVTAVKLWGIDVRAMNDNGPDAPQYEKQ